jgi:DNA-binding CsgD family transcriptional regulator
MLLPDEKGIFNLASTLRKRCLKKITKSQDLQSTSQPNLFQAMLESFIDGILILKTEGELIFINEYARCICRQLMPNSDTNNEIPEEIWRVCQSLIESRQLFPENKIILESEIATSQGLKLRVRARWLQLSAGNDNFLLVTVEDCNQYAQSLAIADSKKYHLTQREAEVWQLRRANLSYKEIANQLYININTVKKHLKNIYAKQQDIFWSNPFDEMQNQ